MLSAEVKYTNFIVFGLTRMARTHDLPHTRGEHINHYTINAVDIPVQNNNARLPFGRKKFGTVIGCRTQYKLEIVASSSQTS